MQYHHNAKTNIQQRRIIKETRGRFSCRDLAERFQTSPETIAKWRRVEHLEDKPSRPNKIYYALSEAEQKIIRKVRKRGLYYRKLTVLHEKTPYQITCDWFKRKPEIFLRDPAILIGKEPPHCQQPGETYIYEIKILYV